MSRTLSGLQKFETQHPEVKQLLSQYVEAFQCMQAASGAPPPLPPRQQTIQQSFAAQPGTSMAHTNDSSSQKAGQCAAPVAQPSIAVPETEYGPLLAAAISKKRSAAQGTVVSPMEVSGPGPQPPAAPQVVQVQPPPVTLCPGGTSPARYDISSGTSGSATPVEIEGGLSSGTYGKAARVRQFCGKCWSVCCR